MKTDNFINKRVVIKGRGNGIIVDCREPEEHDGPEFYVTIEFDSGEKPSTRFLVKSYQSGALRFEDEAFEESFRQFLEGEPQGMGETIDPVAAPRTPINNRIICVKRDSKKGFNPVYSDSVTGLHYRSFDVTSLSKEEKFRSMSPFFVGPLLTAKGETCQRFENFYQYSKVHASLADSMGNPTEAYFEWRKSGFKEEKAHRHPKGGNGKTLYSLFYEETEDGYLIESRLGYIEARKKLYIPSYAKLVVNTEGYRIIKNIYDEGANIALFDVDAYDELDMGRVVNANKVMGHSFVIKMLLQGDIEVVDGQVIDHIGVLE